MKKKFSSKHLDDYDEYPEVTQADLDRAELRVALQPVQRKKRITILLDTGVVDYYRAKAGPRGYQSLINETLRAARDRESLENTLRQIVREEIRRQV